MLCFWRLRLWLRLDRKKWRENHSRFGDFTLELFILELTGSCFCIVNELWTHFADIILELTIYSWKQAQKKQELWTLLPKLRWVGLTEDCRKMESGLKCLQVGWSWRVPRPWFQCWRVGWLVFLCLIVERSMGKSRGVCGFVMLLVMFCVLCWDCLFGCGFCFGCLWWLSWCSLWAESLKG